MEGEAGSEVGVDLRFLLAGQLLLAHADQPGNELFSTGVSCHHLSLLSRRYRVVAWVWRRSRTNATPITSPPTAARGNASPHPQAEPAYPAKTITPPDSNVAATVAAPGRLALGATVC